MVEQLREKCCSTDCSEIAEKRGKSMRDKVTDRCLLGIPLFMQKSLVEMCSLVLLTDGAPGPSCLGIALQTPLKFLEDVPTIVCLCFVLLLLLCCWVIKKINYIALLTRCPLHYSNILIFLTMESMPKKEI